jgi:hypothetical protein
VKLGTNLNNFFERCLVLGFVPFGFDVLVKEKDGSGVGGGKVGIECGEIFAADCSGVGRYYYFVAHCFLVRRSLWCRVLLVYQ